MCPDTRRGRAGSPARHDRDARVGLPGPGPTQGRLVGRPGRPLLGRPRHPRIPRPRPAPRDAAPPSRCSSIAQPCSTTRSSGAPSRPRRATRSSVSSSTRPRCTANSSRTGTGRLFGLSRSASCSRPLRRRWGDEGRRHSTGSCRSSTSTPTGTSPATRRPPARGLSPERSGSAGRMNTTQQSIGVDLAEEWMARRSKSSRTDPERPCRHGTRFAFYGRTSTIGHQDMASSRAWQREAAESLIAGHGTVVAEFFDVGCSRRLPWSSRPEALSPAGGAFVGGPALRRDRDR